MVEALDRGLAYGDGLFETIALVQGQVQLWQAHRQRFIAGLMSLGIVARHGLWLRLCSTRLP